MLAKAEKWIYVKNDPAYSGLWIIRMIDTLAQIEVVLNGEVPMRESVQQALACNESFFREVYIEMVCREIGEPKVRAVLQRINEYLNERADRSGRA